MNKIWWLISKCLAIFSAVWVSSTLSANLTEIALISKSGNVFLRKAKTIVESTPPLSAKDIFLSFKFWNFSNM